ncbi:predicted protein [Sclerotinia sclerotiorum 1980 UF-70]|uniref:Uncharacterized protein n=1 Tax=Sclerotinia sclerotiorum (strain ATCC 18683 / 1980 / Ss-1) TaxID=665079 RepID=A7EIC0_SCLS1|nr:predicted protein [Sclerotinia sclerotiorum 1980 UF-70]EDO02586.1 predicted protein [Sclerotinia sclerotiorum 1980 UF-70]
MWNQFGQLFSGRSCGFYHLQSLTWGFAKEGYSKVVGEKFGIVVLRLRHRTRKKLF